MKLNTLMKIIIVNLEGGFVNHPKDPGGATNYGITAALLKLTKRNDDLKTMKIDRAVEIYDTEFMQPLSLKKLHSQTVQFALLATAILIGPHHGVRLLQDAISLLSEKTIPADGVLGPVTRATLNPLKRLEVDRLIAIYYANVAAYLIGVARHAQSETHTPSPFLYGWCMRLERMKVLTSAIASDVITDKDVLAECAKLEESNAKLIKEVPVV